ncbi:MAG: hypothetical protein VB064_13685 [Oscillospiraceae bacterium]|nr:hypothetical protein [Oscillospiraceae bacterium]
MTEATIQALDGLRSLSTLKWYVIPLLSLVFYVYTKEIHLARKTANWDAVLAGLTVFGLDFFNESWNGWVLALTGRSAVWTAPGDTALRTTVGWNIEIMFMFAILGIIFYYSLSEDKGKKVLGISEKWLTALAYTALCVLIECVLNKAGLLIWEYPWWERTFAGVWLIYLLGYFIFFAGANIMIGLKTMKKKLTMLGVIYAVPIIMNIVGLGIMNWKY